MLSCPVLLADLEQVLFALGSTTLAQPAACVELSLYPNLLEAAQRQATAVAQPGDDASQGQQQGNRLLDAQQLQVAVRIQDSASWEVRACREVPQVLAHA